MQRITVVGSVYYLSDEESSEVTARFTREILSLEQIYTRRLSVNDEWKPLDLGWLASCSMLCIENRTKADGGKLLRRLERGAPGMIEISYTQDSTQSFLVPPQETYFILPSNAAELFIRSNGEAVAMLHAIPE